MHVRKSPSANGVSCYEALAVAVSKVPMPGAYALNRVLQILTNHPCGVD